ncbi:MAG: hypothetical protein QXW58_05855 [Thermosphaera sp.]
MIKLVVPDWDDIIDPNYDFKNEVSSPEYKKDKYRYGVRIWEVFNPPPVNGVLISISTINTKKQDLMRAMGGARGFLKLPAGIQLIGDCGAWQYRNEDVPPYTVEEVLKLYDELGVDYGVTLDHIPFFGNAFERMKLTLENAVKAYELWRPRYEKGNYRFILMASLQGIEIQDYISMFDKLYRKGYRDFAVGGLAKRTTDFIERLVRKLHDKLKECKDVKKLHFLGVVRSSTIPLLEELKGVEEVSLDNATFLRMAWFRTTGNYVLPNGRTYTAIRVLNADSVFYDLLRSYDEGRVGLDEVVKVLREHLSKTGDMHYFPHYVATLRDRPWESCDCPICRSVGIEVLVFKGNNRNRRRGFHNIYVLSKLLKGGELKKTSFRVVKYGEEGGLNTLHIGWIDELGNIIKNSRKVLVLTHCTVSKNVNMITVNRLLNQEGLKIPSFDLWNEEIYRKALKDFIRPAVEMYGGTFTPVKNFVKALRRCGKHVDLLIISARYGILRENDLVIPYEATLKGMRADEIMRWSAERNVNQTLLRFFKDTSWSSKTL